LVTALPPAEEVIDQLITVQAIGSKILLKCRVVWRSRPDDFGPALLQLESSEPVYIPPDRLQLGRLIGGGTRTAEITVYVPQKAIDYVATRVLGSVDPDDLPESDLLVFHPSRRPSADAGVAGAGLYSDGYLLGVVTMRMTEGNDFGAIPIQQLLAYQRLREILDAELGVVPKIADLAMHSGRADDAIKDLSRADPTNIQEVAAAQLRLSNLYYENVLAQANRSFNAAVVAAVAGLALILLAVGVALTVDAAIVSVLSGIGGAVVEGVAGLNFWLYGRTSLQLNRFHIRLERMQRLLVANSVALSLTEAKREEALLGLIRVLMESDSAPEPQGGASGAR
jgi:hypothetical protein